MRGGHKRGLLKVVLAVSACAAVAAPGNRPATAATTSGEQNRAVLVVDTGEQVKKVCIRFWEESISGAELLRRAEVDAALRPYAGKGVAVCSLCGVGCRTDDSCLTCDPDGRYWAYSRAPTGTSAFRLSPAGASNTEVRNGDVEGWRWSRGSSPAYVSVAEVCDGAAPSAASTHATAPDPSATPPPAAAVAPVAAGPPVTTAAPSAGSRPDGSATTGPLSRSPSSTNATPLPPADTSSTSSSSSVSPPSPAASSPDAQALSGRRSAQSDDGGGSPTGLLAFAGLLAGLLGWAARARRRRHRP